MGWEGTAGGAGGGRGDQANGPARSPWEPRCRRRVQGWRIRIPEVTSPLSTITSSIATRRRDRGTDASWLAGQRVLALGAGAVGAPVAEQITRAGERPLHRLAHDQPLVDVDPAIVATGLAATPREQRPDTGSPKDGSRRTEHGLLRPWRGPGRSCTVAIAQLRRPVSALGAGIRMVHQPNGLARVGVTSTFPGRPQESCFSTLCSEKRDSLASPCSWRYADATGRGSWRSSGPARRACGLPGRGSPADQDEQEPDAHDADNEERREHIVRHAEHPGVLDALAVDRISGEVVGRAGP